MWQLWKRTFARLFRARDVTLVAQWSCHVRDVFSMILRRTIFSSGGDYTTEKFRIGRAPAGGVLQHTFGNQPVKLVSVMDKSGDGLFGCICIT